MPEALTRIPTHAAIIVDGNRRWAKNRGLPASFGHKAGFDRLKEITRYAVGDCGIKVLSLYVFSTENFAKGILPDLPEYPNNEALTATCSECYPTYPDSMPDRYKPIRFPTRYND